MTLNCSCVCLLQLEKFIFTERTEMYGGLDLFFNNKYRSMAWNHYPSILICLLTSAGKKPTFFKNYY